MRWQFMTKFHSSRKLYELIEIFHPTKSKEVKWKQNFFETRRKSARDNLHSKPTPLPLVPNLTRNNQKLFIQFLHRLKALCLRFRTVCLTCLNSENWRHDVIGKEKGRTFCDGGSIEFVLPHFLRSLVSVGVTVCRQTIVLKKNENTNRCTDQFSVPLSLQCYPSCSLLSDPLLIRVPFF